MLRPAPRGFTLIEMVIAIAIVVVVMSGAVYSIGALTGSRAKESTAQLAGVIHNLYDTAALSGKTCRLVFDLPAERDEKGTVSWRAECAKSGVTAGAQRDDELKAAADKKKDKINADDKRFRRMDTDQPSLQDLQDREKNRVEEAAKFSSFSSEEVAEQHLANNVRLEVWTGKQKDRVKYGPAYLYFFPQGFTERSQIWVRQGSNVWTLTVAPLTGKTAIYGEELEVPRL